jgi:hypothetical protein
MKLQKRLLTAMVLLPGLLGLLAVPGPAISTEPACVSTVRFDLDPKGPVPRELQGEIVLRSVEKNDAEPLTFKARVGVPVAAELPCSSRWEASAVFPEVWSPRMPVVADPPDTTAVIRLALWPLGRIAGSVKLADKKERLPKKLAVSTLPPRSPASKDVPKGVLDCPVDAQGQWQCPPLPATAFDLVLSAEGFIPQYRWEVKVLPGKTADLGPVQLERGASMAGWVEVEGGRIEENCRARLTPLVSPGGGAAVTQKIRNTTNEVNVRKDGFFQLVGVAPGSYLLEVSQEGFAPATVQPIEVWPRSETFLRQPVTLKRPIRLELSVSPPLDWLGRPWKVRVARASDANASFYEEVFSGSADDQGLATIPGQAPGRFRVSVSDALDNDLASKSFQIAGPEDGRQTIEMEILTIRGTVTLGKEPLAATLWFGGRRGSPGVKMESDSEGGFHGVLPRDGWWPVDVASPERKLETRTKVKVEAGRDGLAEVEIELPATRVFGKVLDEKGRPMPSARLVVNTPDADVLASADEAGSFDVRGLSEGMVQVSGVFSSGEGEWTSDRIALFLRDGEETGPIELRMRKNRRFSGTVQSPLGPVPGASILVIPLRPPSLAGTARTDLDGSFTALVPAATESAVVIVSPPGHALKAFTVPVGDAPQTLRVGREGGELEVLVPEKSEDIEREEVILMVFQNGLPLPTRILNQWALGHGRDLAIPGKVAVADVAPGEYRACLTARVVLASWEASGWTAPLAKCTTGQLTAGGTLRLDLSGD